MLNQLIHKGILVPEPPQYHGLTIRFRGQEVKLNAKQEEMAFAWVKKLGTPYVEDAVFEKNFFTSFSEVLAVKPVLKAAEVDFSTVIAVVQVERLAREKMTPEEKKSLAAWRKAKREELKETYGHAIADGERIELANYIVEPSGIFMGRGKHPLRGKWKEGAGQCDITLNLSPDAERPEGQWKEIVWQPEGLWVAKWEDKLTQKLKYIWLHDTAPIKQEREAQKFDKAIELAAKIDEVRDYIQKNMEHEDFKIRKVATACYLIDALCLRVGDEKDEDEADTVGATTLRPEHVKLLDGGVAEFHFLGKDSVLWHKKLTLPANVQKRMREVLEHARPSGNENTAAGNKPQLFPDITSRDVNAFLSEKLRGLSAKVFRTFHASTVVQKSLDEAGVVKQDPEYKKWEATVRANMQAAILCNHTKKAPANWDKRKEAFRSREQTLQKQLKSVAEKIKIESAKIPRLRAEMKEKRDKAKKREFKNKVKSVYEKKIQVVQTAIDKLALREEKLRMSLGKLKAQIAIASKNRTWNLGTSQKSYIDPRVFYNWGRQVDYDVIGKYYSSTLRRKFMWVKAGEAEEDAEDN